MEVVIDPKVQSYVDQSLASGTFPSFDQMVNEALLLLQKQEAQRRRFNILIAEGLDDVANGRVSSGDVVRERLRESRKKLG